MVPETNRTVELKDNDIAVMDFTKQRLLIFEAREIRLLAHDLQIAPNDIHASVLHHHQHDEDEVYLINGYCFMTVRDYMVIIQESLPLRQSPFKDTENNPSITSSQRLYQVYGLDSPTKSRPCELLSLETGEIQQFYSPLYALQSLERSLYDILRIPLYPRREITDYEHYIFPVIDDKYILRLSQHFVQWEEYVYHALGDEEGLQAHLDDILPPLE